MVELVCVHTASPASLAVAVRHGHTGLHHVARLVENIGAEAARLEASGHPQVLLAVTTGGQRFAFHDGADVGHLLEIYEPTDRLRRFYAGVAAAARGWDGSDLLRPVALATAGLAM